MTSLSSIKKSGFAISLIVWLFSCGGGKTAPSQAEGDTLAFKYATQLSVVRYDGYTVATLKNPWKEGMTLHQYVLVPKDQESVPMIHGATVIRTPLSRSMIFSTVHCAMLIDFGKQDCIAGVADLKYIKIPWIQQQVKQGKISDVGDGLSPVIEKIIDQRPDALFLSPFENSGGYGKLEDIDIPIVECAEYMESTPLGRAEWLRFYGLLFGCEKAANRLFAEVEKNYTNLKDRAQEAGQGRSVVVDSQVGSVWYVPGGRSTIGQMIADAGGRYPWADDEHSGSLSLPFETVLEEAFDTEVWMFRYDSDKPMSRERFLSEKDGYDQFRAFQSGELYGCNVRTSRFYEESPFRPDRLLNDFIQILHPEMKGLGPLRYYKKIE
jgi:iron complex transport system substrate-binding protein